MIWTYVILAVLLFAVELVYFKIADYFNIIDKPNERSSHTRIVLRGGGIIFTIALWIWSIWTGIEYPWMLAGVTLAAGISFVDDIGFLHWDMWWIIPIALIAAVGGTNIFNFMDGINGITGGYALAMLIPLYLKNEALIGKSGEGFVDGSLLIVMMLSVLVFCFFNFRTKAKCFAGDVGSIGMALILVFCLGRLMYVTGDITWIVLYLLYGVDGMLTICHRIMLHENLGQAHRKHVFQLMANELKIPHVVVSSIYMVLQLAFSLVAIYVVPDTIVAHWIYLIVSGTLVTVAYILFKMKYYHLHEEYLASLKKQ